MISETITLEVTRQGIAQLDKLRKVNTGTKIIMVKVADAYDSNIEVSFKEVKRFIRANHFQKFDVKTGYTSILFLENFRYK